MTDPELCRVSVVGVNPSDLSGGIDYELRPFVADEIIHCTLIAKIEVGP